MLEGLTKKGAKKNKKNKNLPRVLGLGTRGRGSSPSAGTGHSGKPANFLAPARSAQP